MIAIDYFNPTVSKFYRQLVKQEGEELDSNPNPKPNPNPNPIPNPNE